MAPASNKQIFFLMILLSWSPDLWSRMTGCCKVMTNAVLVEVPGKWCDYQLAVVWRHDEAAMQVSCRIDLQIDPLRYGEMALLASLLNKQIFIGYLALDVITGELEMRYTLALRGAGGATPEQIEDVVTSAW